MKMSNRVTLVPAEMHLVGRLQERLWSIDPWRMKLSSIHQTHESLQQGRKQSLRSRKQVTPRRK
jgi:hypothetical protein